VEVEKRNMRAPVTVGFLCVGLLALSCPPGEAFGKKRAASAPAQAQASEQTTRAIGELAGKFKWGMSPDEVMAILEREIRTKFEPRIREERDPFKQDAIRREMMDVVEKMRGSYIKFDGQKSGWDVSVVDREFGHKNDESMVTFWETNQRRFLFFWKDRLYKQYIALAVEKFKGKSFDEFSEIIQARYGKANINFAKMHTQDEMALDSLEWPPAGEFVLRAYDNTNVYGNFCLALMQRSVYQQVESERQKRSPQKHFQNRGTAIVDVVGQENTPTDPNEGIVDQLVGRKAQPSVKK